MSRLDLYWEEAEYGKILHHPFNPKFMERLKAEVPDEEHEWRGHGRWISDAYLREVKLLINEFFEE